MPGIRTPSRTCRATWHGRPTASRITVQGDERVISANNLPDHATGRFPISPDDPAYRYDRNPNAIRPQDILLRLPLHPQVAATPSCVPMGMIGFTTDGVAIYNAVDNGGIDAVAHEVQDRCNGHPQRRGQYHYHGPSPCMPNETTAGLVGYALDGFGIYGERDLVTGRILHDTRPGRLPRHHRPGDVERQGGGDVPLRAHAGVPVHPRLLPRHPGARRFPAAASSASWTGARAWGGPGAGCGGAGSELAFARLVRTSSWPL